MNRYFISIATRAGRMNMHDAVEAAELATRECVQSWQALTSNWRWYDWLVWYLFYYWSFDQQILVTLAILFIWTVLVSAAVSFLNIATIEKYVLFLVIYWLGHVYITRQGV